MISSLQDGPACQWISHLATFLDRRFAPRLAWLFLRAAASRAQDCHELDTRRWHGDGTGCPRIILIPSPALLRSSHVFDLPVLGLGLDRLDVGCRGPTDAMAG
jgi:hypothetical protein